MSTLVFVILTYVIRIDWFLASENAKNNISSYINHYYTYSNSFNYNDILYTFYKILTYDSSCFGKHHQQWQKCEGIPRSFVC